MDLSRLLKFTALILFIITLSIQSSQTRYHGRRQKRQYGAQLYLPESYIIPNGEGSNPNEWGPWSSPSECSRSCGGGVAYQTRECYNYASNGAPLCNGGNRKYFSCNTQDCPDDEQDFRTQQCSRFNNVPFEGIRYEWIPYTKAPNPCELNCMPRGERFYYRHKSKVIDGTRCNDESLDVCVDGKCEPVGCDMMLGSPAREDKCRKCAGDGSSCRTVSGLFDMNNLQVGYNDILLIPSGATNINIQEIAPSNNYLACRNLTGHYYLNGNWRIDFPRPMLFAGSWWHYERKPQGFAAPDHLTCMGPTTEAIYIVLLYQDRNVGVQYEYSVPEYVGKSSEPDLYSWTFSPFGACSASCGGGFQTRSVTCHSRNNLEPVDDSLCDSTNKPADTQQCGQEECAPRWSEGRWGKCSKPCGQGGKQQRIIQCERVSSSGTTEIVEDSVCLELVGNKPATEQDCNKDNNCPKWHTGPWKPCSQLCGEGLQTRKVTCYREENGKKKIVADSECPEEKPETDKACMLQPCEGVDWILSPWSGCKECGMSIETRTAICGSKSGKVYNESFCSDEKPELQRPCKGKICKYQWFSSEWSKCSATCGKGVQTRIVLCGQFDGKTVTPAAENSNCNADAKPKDTQECEAEIDECTGQWFVGPWSKCSKKCGGGERHREVVCLANGKPASNCDKDSVEFSSEKCNAQPCEADETIPVDDKEKGITISAEEEYEECEDEDEETSDEDIFGVDLFTPKSKEEIKISDGIDLDTQQTTESSLITDELMLSDSTGLELETMSSEGTTDILGSTIEGSADETLTTEASGEEMTSIQMSSSTEGISSSSESPGTTESMETEVSGSTETLGSTEGVSSTEVSGSTEIPDSTEVSASTEMASSTEVTGSTEMSGTTDVSGMSETTTGGTSDASESTESSPSSPTTEESSTEMSSSTESTESSLSTESSTDVSISSTISTDTTATDMSSTMAVSESSETTLQSESTSEQSTTTSSGETTVSSDESTVTITTMETSEFTTGETESTSSPESTVEISTVSGITETTVSGSTEETQKTDSTVTESTESTVSGSTEETGSTESTVEITTSSSESEETTIDIWSTTESGLTEFTSSAVFTELVTRKCSKKKKVDCSKSEFGCCPDNKTLAIGPFDEGCPIVKTCEETKFGCCPDGLSPAEGKNNKGCPKSLCAETIFGCCPDKYTPAEGEDNEGCPEPTTTTTVSGCAGSKHGCCPDGITEAKGPKNKGCEETTTALPEGQSGEEEITKTEEPELPCEESEHGCCPDGKTTAKGKDFEGCDIVDKENCSRSLYGCCADNRTSATGPDQKGCEPCAQEPFGCCPDGKTPAHGHNSEGCCINTPYGCCPDNINAANGPNSEGCDCKYAPYGCCPDRRTAARGPSNEGCGCQYSEHGCCPDKITAAGGENFEGCPCHTFQFGCCPDGITVAKGPHRYGCYCSQSEFKCCPDDVTPAKGPDYEGCTCLESKYGCCPDGVTAAEGKNFEGCENVIEPEQKSCALQKDTGPCTNFTIKYFFDANYGGCTRFWYGGCEGNGNRFETEAECESICANYEGKESCLLPKSTGPCAGYFKRFYFDSDRKQCLEFNYGGCMGNTNRFESKIECEAKCAVEETLPPCEQPVDRGPCAGNFERWYYDNETDTCRSFSYGGCKGNKNNYATEHACNYNCKKPGVLKESCTLPKETGECDGLHAKWYFSQYDNKCMPFYHTGCGGNKNNFYSLEQCEEKCPKSVAKDICEIPAEVGECTNYEARWYYDTKDKRCAQFYYGGCGGNENNFKDEDACLQRCERKPETSRLPEQPQRPDEGFSTESCFLLYEEGNCQDYQTRWYYNSAEGICSPFTYTGCGGNANNFPNEEECDNSCAHAQSACSLRPIYGACGENHTRWYYDERDQRCHEFAFSGCQGNRNNFFTETECLDFCGQSPTVETKPKPQPSYSVCDEPVAAGNCEENILSWYYDNEQSVCKAFYYTGCDGNGNRFQSREQCERQCGDYKGVDVCNEPVEPGPCDQWQTRYYYDQRYRSCMPFSYSGCEGNGNRFVSMDECESLCIKHEEPRSGDNKEICLLPVETGECTERATSSKRWHFDNSIGTCLPFIYSGCAGNQNNFRSYESCVEFCSHIDDRINPEEIRTDAPNVCDIYEQECQTIRCPYGVQKTYAPEGCQRCECKNPCEGYTCPDGSTCVVDLAAGSSYETQFVPTCRETSKPGECPSLSTNTSRCSRECNTDADCRDDSKCCYDGCGYVCVRPAVPQVEVTTLGPTRSPYPGEAAPALENRTQSEVDVDSPAGSYAVLKCFATGYPPPSISWRRGQVVINTNQGRYVLGATGDLTIVQVHRSDTGTYVCIADNGLGTPVSREINLRVSDARPTDAYIVGPRNASVIATLKQPATLRCPAGGHPSPIVSWWRGKDRLPLVSPRFEVNRHFSLVFRSVELSDLGTYTCEAYSGRGRPASIQRTLKAIGPVYITNEADRKYLKYIVDPPTTTTTPKTIPVYPFRPIRLPPRIIPSPVIVQVAPRQKPVSALLRRDQSNTYAIGTEMVLYCDVDGYPQPNVTWTKDDIQLIPSNKIQVTENPHRLVVYDLTSEDSGFYACTARNEFSYNTFKDQILIEGIYIPPDCKDNQFFANCELIVQGHYCSNQYYAKFCCRACTLAGQIPVRHPNALV